MSHTQRTLPVFGVVAEALTLAARHTGKLLLWVSPLALTGLAAVGLLAIGPESAALSLAVQAGFALVLVVYWSAFSVRVHRLILLPTSGPNSAPGSRPDDGPNSGPGDGLGDERSRDLPGSVRRSVGGLLLLGLLAVLPTVCGLYLGGLIMDAGLPGLLGPIAAFTVPYFGLLALLGKRQLLYLTDISLNGHASWKDATAMGRGFGLRLAGVNMVSGLFILGVSVFSGWMIGNSFVNAPQGLLEFLTIVVGLPAQLGFFACLQAACYGRLRLPSAS
ncbi:hypothetical protein [Fundidesulfovibrio putealis]|uniref:hypothetical protein n=1 Tax=Fundidesulfovibrio putealis TaxID=270496 RepID=UPI0004865E3D|nr:hypothetical protein [Fundidesulfovibrio putealis]